MSSKPDYIRKKFGPLREKNLQTALAHLIAKEFPRLGGPRIRALCADLIMQVVNGHMKPLSQTTPGQVLWMAVNVNKPPALHQKIADTDLVPVVLDLSTPEDVELRIKRAPAGERLLKKVLRLCHQAYKQGGLLSNCDIAELLHKNDSSVARVLTQHERATNTIVPRRATLHDVGTGLTHKRIICFKRFVEGKEPHLVARETYHSLEAVDRYLGQYDRVRHCRLRGLTPAETAHALGCTVALVRQYLEIDDLLSGKDA